MKITLVIGDGEDARSIIARLPYENADHVVLDESCPNCEHEPCRVRGRGTQWHGHDTHYAVGFALCCNAQLGRIEVKVSTIFGIEEDRRVLEGRHRVY